MLREKRLHDLVDRKRKECVIYQRFGKKKEMEILRGVTFN
jgi:hypothetical protein